MGLGFRMCVGLLGLGIKAPLATLWRDIGNGWGRHEALSSFNHAGTSSNVNRSSHQLFA